jgi:hypothetical protein
MMERKAIKSDSQLTQFRALGLRGKNIADQNLKKDTDYSDAPDEFRGMYTYNLIVCAIKSVSGLNWANLIILLCAMGRSIDG